MATDTTKTKTPKTPKAPVAINVRVQEQLTRAVLAKKITKEELVQIREKTDKLIAFMDV